MLDYFAGSGTTSAVAMKLGRRFVAVEMGDYFDSDMLWRMKQVLFGRQVGISSQTAYSGGGMFKYIRLESYEDALNNIRFDDGVGQRELEFDDYLLRYMLRWETRDSETLLDVEKLSRPYDYTLNVHNNGQTAETVVDVAETFNYLIGLNVRRRQVYFDGDRRYLIYRGVADHQVTIVIWRETSGWRREDLQRDKRFVATLKLTDGADRVFVNGDSFIPGATALDPVFKGRMFAPVER